jgi:hypothetical protein
MVQVLLSHNSLVFLYPPSITSRPWRGLRQPISLLTWRGANGNIDIHAISQNHCLFVSEKIVAFMTYAREEALMLVLDDCNICVT